VSALGFRASSVPGVTAARASGQELDGCTVPLWRAEAVGLAASRSGRARAGWPSGARTPPAQPEHAGAVAGPLTRPRAAFGRAGGPDRQLGLVLTGI